VTQSVPVKLYVGNLAEATTENELRQLFARAGQVLTVHLMRDLSNGRPEGHAFVTMATAAGAQKAIATFREAPVGQRQLTVNIAEPSMTLGLQSRLGAFGATTRSPRLNRFAPSQRGGFQSKLGAFGDAGRPPTPPRRGRRVTRPGST
jgi:RNA recognition motif-containing protein